MRKCDYCGKDIKFIRNKKEKVNIPVNPAIVCFVPSNGYGNTENFINAAGQEVKGHRTKDGIIGYKRHEC